MICKLRRKQNPDWYVFNEKEAAPADNSARIGEEIEVYAKTGKSSADLQFYIGDIASTPSMRESKKINVVNLFEENDSTLVAVEVFTFKVPEGATVGVTNVYFTVNGVKHTARANHHSETCDILYPGRLLFLLSLKQKEAPAMKNGSMERLAPPP